MLNYEDFEFLAEARMRKIRGTKTTKKCIVFTDVRKSSELWSEGGSSMFDAILKHEDEVFKISESNGGEVIKSIGDAYMITFDSLSDGINFAIELQSAEKIKVGKIGSIETRIGICYGDVYEHNTTRQSKKLVDYFGNTVNTASRLESKVSDVGGFAFGFCSGIKRREKDEILAVIDEKCTSCVEFDYSEDKTTDPKRKRSGRLLNDTQNYVHKSINKLNGVDELFVYSVKGVK